jgi:hypothetical protein
MRFRKLRIAWSVVCGIICLLLIVLWVRSYWWSDLYIAQLSSQRYFGIGDTNGRTFFGTARSVGHPAWTLIVEPSENRAEYFPRIDESVYAGGVDLYLPNWMLVILTATLAAAPWISWSKRFSLRTLLIATTLVAVVLGLIVWLR